MKLKHDKELDIATANSRRAKTWRNEKRSWSALVQKMINTTRTSETSAEYAAMSKDRQSDIKDVGGYVGGYCSDGRRTNVKERSVLTLDADYAEAGLWEDWKLLFGNAACYYSTHKHSEQTPRLRIVVPLARNVTPDEYQAIGRRVAADLGIDQFDDSTYQAERLMYWPSTSKDAPFDAGYVDGPFLEPDAVLGSYKDWKDISAWPMSSRVAAIAKKAGAKQADPLEKSGLVGAFCRAYSIEEAIEAFVPQYAACDIPGRYTYIEGSAAAGVTTYEGRFSYSFHSTDPASGILCNAWDLVRLHRFHELDENSDPNTPVAKMPSWKAMTEMAQANDRVRAQAVSDKVADFDEIEEPAAAADWMKELRITKDGSVASTIDNIVIILRHDPTMAGLIAYDEFTHSIVITGPLPWRQDAGAWSDSDDSALRYFLEKRYGLSGKDKIFDAVNVVAMENKIHPVREYLDSCEWDGVPRVERLFVDYLGAEDNEYTRTVTRKTLVAAVARIYNPGCKFDYMLTLQGRQGIGKSAIFRALGGRWYSDSFMTVQGKEAYEQLHGVWIIEVGELAGMRKAESEAIKLYLSKTSDRFRPAYGRRTQEFPRQCIFIGTTNESQFLRDSTGNRRFWVVNTPNEARLSIWDDLTPDIVSRIWAEAVVLYHRGEELYLGRDMEDEARLVQQTYEEENPKAGIVASYLDRLLPEDWSSRDIYSRRLWLDGTEEGAVRRQYICTLEIVSECFGGNAEKTDRYVVKEINTIMCQLPGWKRMGASVKDFGPYGRQRYYKRED